MCTRLHGSHVSTRDKTGLQYRDMKVNMSFLKYILYIEETRASCYTGEKGRFIF